MAGRQASVRVSAVAAAAAFVVAALYFSGVVLRHDPVGRSLGGCVWCAIGGLWLWQHLLARRQLAGPGDDRAPDDSTSNPPNGEKPLP